VEASSGGVGVATQRGIQASERSTWPVFVMGCHRSGTNLLYDNLLSAGGFAVYKMLIPRFGSIENPDNRRRILDAWLRSKGFRRSGLDVAQVTAKVMDECRSGGDFLRITMGEIARQQNVARWAVYDPDNVLYVPRIKADIPQALFIHIVRDGRDIALSLKKMGGFQPLPWDRRSRSLLATAMYWEWMVHRGREYGRQIPADYIEVRYEDLVSEPRKTLARLGQFLDHDLDYDRIQSAGLGRLRESNSSFLAEAPEVKTNPMNRWKERLTREEVAALEALVGDCLEELSYPLTTPQHERQPGLRERWMRAVYPTFLDTKLWLKLRTPVGRMANLSALELSEAAVPNETDAG
jgi:sulfotransferase family protein